MLHTTLILDGQGSHSLPDRPDGGGPYVAICTCPWRSGVLSMREQAVRAASIHRLNANIQEENP